MESPAVDLDRAEELAAVDSSGMLGVLERFPGQLQEALEIGRSEVPLPSPDGVSSVVVLGMGGSGISGAVAGSVTSDRLSVPLTTISGYRLPEYVGEDTLVFAVSYSGNTEETIYCVEQAIERGARLVAISSGGRLSSLSEERGFPQFRIPGGLQPRAAVGYLCVPLLAALERMGLVTGLLGQVEAAVSVLEERSREYRARTALDDNPTKRLAVDLLGFLPVVYGSEGALSVAATRWKTQFNENSKVLAFHNRFPELNHNETVGWRQPAEICSLAHLVVLRDRDEHPRIGKRIDITLDLLKEDVGRITQVYARGSNTLEKLLDLIYFGDYTSVYLALALRQDPTPVLRIEELKRRLAESLADNPG